MEMESAAAPASPPRAPQPRLRVVIADDHHHVLPEIHYAIRRRALPFESLHIVHWDAHPDLSFSSSVGSSLVFEPEQLYDALDDSPSGIAEFLLPLVFAGHVDRISWIKSPWAGQMQAGDSMEGITVGRLNDSDRLKVSCPWAHFIDDSLYAPESAMDPATSKRWDLFVTEDPLSVASTVSTPWILDIDLDYFSTWNPFRKDLEVICSPPQIDLLTHVFTRPRHRRPSSPLSPPLRALERLEFLEIMELIEQMQPSQIELRGTELVDALLPFYDEDDHDDKPMMDSLLAFLDLLATTEEETRDAIWEAAPCLDLPHHESSESEIERLLDGFRAFLEASKASNPPALVTIAMSVSDRFLPQHQLAFVKPRVLAILDEVVGPLRLDEIEYDDAGES